MDKLTPWEKDEDELIRQYNDGEITLKEYKREIRELRASYRQHAEEAARDAYAREMERW